MNVLSLFDGISCGQVALERAEIKVDNYFASEIDKYAISVTMKNFPNTIQLGDVAKLNTDILPKIDLLIGGSPCQDLSRYKTDGKGLNGSKSNLFYQYIRILKETKPKYFLLENVNMKEEYKDIITKELGVRPVEINSKLVSAQDRRRLYWTNIPNVDQPKENNIYLKDIILKYDDVPDKYWINKPFIFNGEDKRVICTLDIKTQDSLKRVYNINGKSPTLTCDGDGGNRQKKIFQNGKCRKLMPIEYERLQTLPDNYTDCISDSRRYSAIGNGWTVDVIAHIFKNLK